MIGATKRWFRRNRKGLAIGAGVVGVGYLAGQYVLSKISEARERMSSDRIAKEKYDSQFSFFLFIFKLTNQPCAQSPPSVRTKSG